MKKWRVCLKSEDSESAQIDAKITQHLTSKGWGAQLAEELAELATSEADRSATFSLLALAHTSAFASTFLL